MRVIDIIKEHILRQGFDGLVQEDAECGCVIDDLAPCGGDISNCEPGYRGVCTDPHPDKYPWAVYRTKEAAQASEAAAKDNQI